MIISSKQLMTLATAALTFTLTGCGTNVTSSAVTQNAPVSAGVAVQGAVFGGQQPVSNATMHLYAVSTSGYGTASTSLLTKTVTTSSTGTFSIAGDYTCPTGALVYIVATQGNPGTASASANNSALAMMAGLGACGSITGTTIEINELTTVASVWALSPFMTSYTAVGTSPTNVQGITNAFATIDNVVNVSTGTLPGTTLPTGATLPTTLINTIADILATCINTVDQAGGGFSSDCTSLFSYTPNTTGTPTDTIQVAINLSQNPALSLTPLTQLINAIGAPYQPALSSPPTSWTLAINYVGGGLSNPKAIATDASGNVWVANNGNNSVTKLSTIGTAISGTSGFAAGSINTPTAIAVDTSGAPWVANSSTNTLTHLTAAGTSGTLVPGGGLNAPSGIAIDSNGNIWVSNSGNSTLSEFTSTGTALSTTTGFTGGGLNLPTAIAIE
jgi:hypothetical protein